MAHVRDVANNNLSVHPLINIFGGSKYNVVTFDMFVVNI